MDVYKRTGSSKDKIKSNNLGNRIVGIIIHISKITR